MANPLEQVSVPRVHLETVSAALSHSYGYFHARDLQTGYLNVNPSPRTSRLTAEVKRAADLLNDHLEVPEDELSDE